MGGIGLAPGASLADSVAFFEATHGTGADRRGQGFKGPLALKRCRL